MSMGTVLFDNMTMGTVLFDNNSFTACKNNYQYISIGTILSDNNQFPAVIGTMSIVAGIIYLKASKNQFQGCQ